MRRILRLFILYIAIQVNLATLVPKWSYVGIATDGPSPRAYFGNTYTQQTGRFYVAGGETNTNSFGSYGDVWVYSARNQSWTQLANFSLASEAPGSRKYNSVFRTPAQEAGGGDDFYTSGGYVLTYSSPFRGYIADVHRFTETGAWQRVDGPALSALNNVNTPAGYADPGCIGARGHSHIWINPLNGSEAFAFGGYGYQQSGSTKGQIGDIWMFNVNTYAWTYVGGPQSVSQPVVSSPEPSPGSREGAGYWTSSDGDMWMFGGLGPSGLYSDLWRWNGTKWAQIAGNTSPVNQPGTYGLSYRDQVLFNQEDQTIESPGGRRSPTTWVGINGMLFMFGGYGYGFNASAPGYLQDLWAFNLQMNKWVHIMGPKVTGLSQNTALTPSSSVYDAIPAGRVGAAAFNANGTVHLFGGLTFSSNSAEVYLNDIWTLSLVDVNTPPTSHWKIQCESGNCHLPPGYISNELISVVPPIYPNSTLYINENDVLFGGNVTMEGTISLHVNAQSSSAGSIRVLGCMQFGNTSTLNIEVAATDLQNIYDHNTTLTLWIASWSSSCQFTLNQFTNVVVRAESLDCTHSASQITNGSSISIKLELNRDNCPNSSHGTPLSVIIGLVVSSIALSAVIAIAVVLAVRRHRHLKESHQSAEKPAPDLSKPTSIEMSSTHSPPASVCGDGIPLELILPIQKVDQFEISNVSEDRGSKNALGSASISFGIHQSPLYPADPTALSQPDRSGAGSREPSDDEAEFADSKASSDVSTMSSVIEHTSNWRNLFLPPIPKHKFHQLLVDWDTIASVTPLQTTMFGTLFTAKQKDRKPCLIFESTLAIADEVSGGEEVVGGNPHTNRAFEEQLAILAALAPQPGVAKLEGIALHNGHYNLLFNYSRPTGSLASVFIAKNDTGEELHGGVGLRSWCTTAISLPAKLNLLKELASACHFLHRNGQLLYKNFTSENILVTGNCHPKFITYGLTQFMDLRSPLDPSTWPCLRFMAPEVIRGGTASLASDVYAFGVVAFECLAEEKAFAAVGAEDIVLQLQHFTEGYVVEAPGWCPSAVRVMLARATAADPEDRPSFYQLRTALKAVVSDSEESFGLAGGADEL